MQRSIAAAGALALGLSFSSAALAQTTLTGIEDLDERIEDIERDTREDLARGEDAARFGNPEFRTGLSGSASLSFSAKNGNNETEDLTATARLRYAQGRTVQTFGAVLEFSESGDATTQEDAFAIYDFNYYFDDRLYGFALARVESNGLADAADENKTDGFIGFGPGYRVVNRPDMTWRVQAGVGLSYLEDGLGESDTETGYIASSRFYYRINETMFVSNDTDILKSDSALRVNNEIGLNFKMTDAFSTRVSYLTDYNDSRAIETDNTVGVALVFSF